MPETYVKGTSGHNMKINVKNMKIKQLCKQKAQDFAMAFWVGKLFRTFKKQAH